MQFAKLVQFLIMQFPLDSLRTAALSYDHERLHGQPGMDLLTRQRGYPRECLWRPAEHLEVLTRQHLVGSGFLVTQTFRNCPQNPRCPLYSREHGICQTAEEQVDRSERPYYGIGFFQDGRFRGCALGFRQKVPSDMLWWAGGVPVLWDGQVLDAERAPMASEIADFCHVWQLRLRGPHRSEEDVARYLRLTAVFHEHLHTPAEAASQAIRDEARSMGLKRENNYLHNAVGVSPDHLIVVVAHGPLEQIGELARTAGATHALVVDNGGSVQIGFRRPGPRTDLTPLFQAPDFRQPTITLAAYELDWDDTQWIPLESDCRLGSST